MKEFRIAKCLSEDGMSVRRYAIFKDKSRNRPIEVDENGKEYFSVDNWIQSEPEMDEFNHGGLAKYLKYSFSGKPKDMVDSVRMGYGDVIHVTNLFGRIESVLYFLDREYGEILRQKTLEGWKDAVYKYVLYFNSIPLDINNGRRDFNRENIYFESAKDAIKMAERLISDSTTLAFKLEGLPFKKDADYMIFSSYIENPVSDLVFEQLEDIYEYGDIMKINTNIPKRKLENMFTIKQEPIQ